MGREIRRVPPDWKHPTQDCPHSPWAGGCDISKKNGGRCYRPLFDEDFLTAAREWMDECLAWEHGDNPEKAKYPFYWQWDGGPPDEESYRRAWKKGEATAYQIYETVSEGTPVSPVFLSLADLKQWLLDQGYSEAAAEGFSKDGYVPSMVMAGGKLYSGIESAALPK